MQPVLFPTAPTFDGPGLEPEDSPRLGRQLEAVKRRMADGRWYTLAELAEVSHGSEAGVSARLRDLRKPKFGGYEVERMRVSGGLYAYRLVLPAVRPFDPKGAF